jgi:methyltransferase (TIGR00027 family)
MDASRASRTAEGAAIMRALHQQLPPESRILEDPISVMMVDPHGEAYQARKTFISNLPEAVRLRLTNFEMRSRYTEDCLADACRRGVRQYVLLGAGLDTFAFRQPPWAQSLRIFEVDHPATQSFKKERLKLAGIDLPQNVRFAPIDFDSVFLPEGLAKAGFDSAIPTFFSMLGVCMYLTPEAFDRTLEFVLKMPKASEFVFTIVVPDDALPADEAEMAAAVAARNASWGEPWLMRPYPNELVAKLLEMGFSQAIHVTPDEANELYFRDRSDGLNASNIEQMIRVIV